MFTSSIIRSRVFAKSFRPIVNVRPFSSHNYLDTVFKKKDVKENKKKQTIETMIDTSTSVRDYVKSVYRKTGKYLGITAVSGVASIGLGSQLYSYMGVVSVPLLVGTGLTAFGVSLYSAWKICKTDPGFDYSQYATKDQREKYAYMLHTGMGVTLAPSLFMFPTAIPAATILTGALVAGPIMASMSLPKGSLLKYGPAMHIGLWGLIGIGIGGIFFPVLHQINVYGGVAFFTLYSAYDTHQMIDDYENGRGDVIGHATNYSLNAINIFGRLLEILGYKSKD